ncbi:hypothetical protein JW710_04205 [Candidatus Dojkabacteria bacterium]|nr:hypothetical protein [Candidatus Dojkabacteria bacterium]
MEEKIVCSVRHLLTAYQSGKLGDTTMPEDTHPGFTSLEAKRIYYTLPMALNYQRNSYKLWESAKATYEDEETREVFSLSAVNNLNLDSLREKLTKYKLALQPNKHIDTWSRVSRTIFEKWGSLTEMIDQNDSDYLNLKEMIQGKQKKGLPYLSGPKIFNYWIFIMSEYGEVDLKNRSCIEIAPDTHVIQSSVRLGVISSKEAQNLSREEISAVWRDVLKGTEIDPIDVHSPLWFWSRSGFEYEPVGV